jgi:peptide/nickel transport system ATP-binding protein
VALAVEGLTKSYISKRGLFGSGRTVHASKDVTFQVRRGETLGLVGESGSGTSALRGWSPGSSSRFGKILLFGADFGAMHGENLRNQRSRIQMVFQDPFASLNPRRKVGVSIADGRMARGTSREEALAKARELLTLVGLDPRAAERRRTNSRAGSGSASALRGRWRSTPM